MNRVVDKRNRRISIQRKKQGKEKKKGFCGLDIFHSFIHSPLSNEFWPNESKRKWNETKNLFQFYFGFFLSFRFALAFCILLLLLLLPDGYYFDWKHVKRNETKELHFLHRFSDILLNNNNHYHHHHFLDEQHLIHTEKQRRKIPFKWWWWRWSTSRMNECYIHKIHNIFFLYLKFTEFSMMMMMIGILLGE